MNAHKKTLVMILEGLNVGELRAVEDYCTLKRVAIQNEEIETLNTLCKELRGVA